MKYKLTFVMLNLLKNINIKLFEASLTVKQGIHLSFNNPVVADL